MPVSAAQRNTANAFLCVATAYIYIYIARNVFLIFIIVENNFQFAAESSITIKPAGSQVIALHLITSGVVFNFIQPATGLTHRLT